VFFVNKADLGKVATRSAAELRAGLDLGHRRDPNRLPPVLCGSARDNVGIDELIEAIDEHERYLKSTGQGEIRRDEGRVARIEQALNARYGHFGIDRLGDEAARNAAFQEFKGVSALHAIAELGRRIESRLAADDA